MGHILHPSLRQESPGRPAALANGLGWSAVAIYGPSLPGYGSFLFSEKAA